MVLLRKLNNADAGTGTKLGSNDTDKLADYWNDVDVSETPRINTPTEYRSGILKVRDGSNAFNITIKSATQTADRDFTLPAFIGNDSPACLGLANIFTNTQQITLDADTLFNLYRPSSTTNSLNSIGFFHRNSSNASVKYASEASQVITNTTGLEDGKLKWFVKKAGVDTEVMSIDKDGLLTCANITAGGAGVSLSNANTWTAIQTISVDNQRILKLYRPVNTANTTVGFEFQFKNSATTQTTFGYLLSKLITNTAGAEDSTTEISNMKAGTITKVLSIDKLGMVTIGSGQNIAVGGFVYNTGAALDTASTAAEFDILNYSVPANLLGANGMLRGLITGYLLQNQATATDFTIKVKFGTTTIYNALTNIVQGSANLPFRLSFELGNNNATNAQSCSGHFILNDTGTVGLTTGEGSLENDEISVNANFRAADAASTKDTTSAQTLQVTMTHSVSSASVKTAVRRRALEFCPGV